MKADIERWNRKYAAADPDPDLAPDALLVRYRHLLDGAGRALDVACGVGHNALYLARCGYSVTGIDGSPVALERARAVADRSGVAVELIERDLDDYAPAPESFEVIVVIRFLDRALIPRLKRALAPGGLLLYKTFNRNVLRRRATFNTDYTLELGELAGMLADLDTVATNDSAVLDEELTFWVGRKPRPQAGSPATPSPR